VKPMRIVQTPARFEPATGGVERYTLELSRALVARGHSVTVVCADDPGGGPDTIDGVQVRRLRYIGKIANTNMTWGLPRVLAGMDFDVLHTHLPTPWTADVSAAVAARRGCPLVLTYQNDILKDGPAKLVAGAYNRLVLPLLLGRADAIVTTQPGYVHYSRYLGPFSDRVRTIPLGVEVPDAAVAGTHVRDPDQLLFVSVLDRYHTYKGLDVLLEAVALLAASGGPGVGVRLKVVGSGELVEEYRRQADRLGIAERVTFLGYVPDAELDRLYRTSAALVLPSTSHLEGFGIVCLEALVRETPAVTTTITGAASGILSHDAGAVVEPGDVAGLAAAIGRVVAEPSVRDAMGTRGRRMVTNLFTWPAIAEQFEALYAALLADRAVKRVTVHR